MRLQARSEEPDLSALDNVGKEMEDLVDCALAMRRPDSAAPKPAEPREAEKAPAASPAEAAGEKGPPAPRSPKVSKKAKGGSKPAWALTKEAADGVEEEEEEELLSFVDSLDYDNYIETIDDPEVKVGRPPS